MSNISRKVGGAKLALIQHGPTILTVAGIGVLVASGVVAAMRTEKIRPVVEDAEKRLENIRGEAEVNPDYTPAEQAMERTWVYADVTKGFLKVYGPAIALGLVGSAAVLYSHGVMKRRNAALIAAYGILERGYASYRDRVREVVGEEVEEYIYRGHRVEVEDGKGGTRVVKGVEPMKNGHIPPTNLVSEYAAWFDKTNPNWNFRPEHNLFFLRAQEKYANHLLQSRGHVFLNEVYDSLRLPRTSAGSVVGWVWNEGDGYIDFGLPEQGSSEEADYYHFFDEESQFLLDFNVDGVIYHKIDEIKKG